MKKFVLAVVLSLCPFIIFAQEQKEVGTKSHSVTDSVAVVTGGVDSVSVIGNTDLSFINWDFLTLSGWNKASASYYIPKNLGASGRRIRSGSVALGSSITKPLLKKGIVMYIKILSKDLNVQTPYGKNIFRVDDSMGKRFMKEDKFFIDFCYKDLNLILKRMGRFNVDFKIVKVIQ